MASRSGWPSFSEVEKLIEEADSAGLDLPEVVADGHSGDDDQAKDLCVGQDVQPERERVKKSSGQDARKLKRFLNDYFKGQTIVTRGLRGEVAEGIV